MIAGLSVDYVVRLEQGRARNPSVQVLQALARALQLSTDERNYLFRLAGQLAPGSGRMSSHVTPGIQRLLQRLDEFPVSVHDAAWTLIAWNPMWAALMGDPSPAIGRERNLPWRYFAGRPRECPGGRVIRTAEQHAEFEVSIVADLRSAAARYPNDPTLRDLIVDLRQASARFAELWDSNAVGMHATDTKVVEHPEIGRLELDCDVFTSEGSDLRVIAYTAEAGSAAAEKLALLRVVGLQRMSDDRAADQQPWLSESGGLADR